MPPKEGNRTRLDADQGSAVFAQATGLVGYVRWIMVEEATLAHDLGDAYTPYAAGRSRLVPGA